MSGHPTSVMLRDIAARWEEHGTSNTECGVLVSESGPGCAQGDILLHEGGYQKVPFFADSRLYLAKHPETGHIASGDGDFEIAETLGITLEEARRIRMLNDGWGERPAWYLRELAEQYETRERMLEAAELVVGA